MADALGSDKQLNAALSFSYLPVNHLTASGAYDCSKGLDCESTQFDTCLVHEYCWSIAALQILAGAATATARAQQHDAENTGAPALT